MINTIRNPRCEPIVARGPVSALLAVNQRARLALAALLLAMTLALGGTTAHAQDAPAAESAVVNINTADAAALAETLSGVGITRAEAIVRYRESFGPFSSPDELMDVKGIGQSTLEANRQRITLE